MQLNAATLASQQARKLDGVSAETPRKIVRADSLAHPRAICGQAAATGRGRARRPGRRSQVAGRGSRVAGRGWHVSASGATTRRVIDDPNLDGGMREDRVFNPSRILSVAPAD